jgi:hypothetical protein
MPTSPVTHVPTTSPSKSLTTAVAAAPRYKLTTAFFRYSGWVEKSASLIVEALNPTVKKILRQPWARCKDPISRVFPSSLMCGGTSGAS